VPLSHRQCQTHHAMWLLPWKPGKAIIVEKLHGTTYGFFETGTEGIIWTLLKDGFAGYEAIESIEEGDHLSVFDTDNNVLFEGIIQPDYEAGWMEYPLNPGYGQPSALGYWIHWTQKDWKPDDWAKLFMGETPLRATLIKKEK
jgi:hypothetical protein